MTSDHRAESAAGLAELIRRKEVSPVEVLEQAIARIEAGNPKVNAIVVPYFEDARRAARAAEDAVMRGDPLGPLHGVPIAIKDLFDFKPGWVSTFGGIRALKDHVVDGYCAFAERMEQAGAVLVGRTNSPTFGFRGTCDNFLFGPTRNPFDLTRNSGGSSGGSAAAVAAGFLPICEGTDGGGSIRIPAAWCGVYGYKASFGRVPVIGRPNAFGHFNPFIFEGPITRTVEDAALTLNVLAGYDARDPVSIDEDVDFLPALRGSIAGMRIGYTRDFSIFPIDPAVTEIVDAAVQAFAEAGAVVEEVDLGIRRSQRELSDVWCRFIAPLNLAAVEGFKREGIDLLQDHPEDLPPEVLDWLELAKSLTVARFLADQEIRTEIFDAFRTSFERFDLLVSPTLPCLPVENATDGNTVGPAEIEGGAVDRLIGWCMTYLVNFTGNPAATVPAGLAAGNLPVGMQIIGRRYADADVLAASAAFERLRPWADTYRWCRL
jgi:amidase